MGVDRIVEVGCWVSEGQAAEVYGADFTTGSLKRVGTTPGMFANHVF